MSADLIQQSIPNPVVWSRNSSGDVGAVANRQAPALIWQLGSGTAGAYRVNVRDGIGVVGCTPSAPNSTGVAGELVAPGSATAADNELALVARDLPAGEFGLFLNSQTLGAGATPVPTGQVAVTAGQTWHFQAWHRDAAAGGSHLTNSISVAFL